MPPEPAAALRFRRLGFADGPRLARMADAAFRANGFYARALGLDPPRLARYWDLLFDLLLTDGSASVYGLERDGELVAALAVAFDGFPQAWNGLHFLARLSRRIGGRRLVRYLAFVRSYGRVMRRPAVERGTEARGMWLFVDSASAGAPLGARLVQATVAAVRRRGKTLMTGFLDASNGPLLRFYRRQGFTVSSAFPIAGGLGATVERRVDPWPEGAPC